MVIKNLSTLKKFFQGVKIPIFGAGVYAFHRLGMESILEDFKRPLGENFQILSLYNSKETDLIKKNAKVFCLEEEINKRLKPRNSSTLLCHSLITKHLSGYKKPVILLYKSSKRIEKAVKENKWVLGAAPYRFGKQLFEDKVKFRGVLEKIGVSPTPGQIIFFSAFQNSSFSVLKKRFGLPFVVQHPKRGGGKGTFFVRNKDDFQKAKDAMIPCIKNFKGKIKEKKTANVIVAKFINGPSPSITGCVTRYGILSTRPQYQICDIPILYKRPYGSGLFCGHDWSASNFSRKILFQAREIVDKVGNYFKKLHYQGVFGLDFVLDEQKEKLYVVECNPRFLGSFPTLTMAQLENNEPPIIAFHLLEFMGVSYKIDIENLNSQFWQKKEGAQMMLHNPFEKETLQKGEVGAGIYKVKMPNLEFAREGYNLSHLKTKNEFLLTEGIQKKGAEFQPYQRLTRILTKNRVLDQSLRDINPEAKKMIRLILKKFDLKKKDN